MVMQMVSSLFLHFLLIASVSTKKEGDFGIFSICTKNNTIRLSCYYPTCTECKKCTSFSCEFFSNGTRLGNTSGDSCQHFHEPQLPINLTNYTCRLTRNKRREYKTLIKVQTYKLKICSGTTGMHLHLTLTLLWPLMVLPLWEILLTEKQLA